MQTPRVAVLGAGSWGTALAALSASQADTLLWARDPAVADAIQASGHHPRHLTDIALPPALRATADLHAAVRHALPLAGRPGLLILGVPVAGLQDICSRLGALLRQPDARGGQTQSGASIAPDDAMAQAAQGRPVSPPGLAILWTCKGFHPDTGQLPHQIVQQALADAGLILPPYGGNAPLPGTHSSSAAHTDTARRPQGAPTATTGANPPPPFPIGLGVLSGPSFAREVAQGLPVALTVASADAWVAQAAVAAMHGTNARIYSSHDIVGVEVGGALKNIMAIACGISDGLGLGDNARAALITRGLAEMQRLGLALGGHGHTFSGLTGMGDLVLTATGALSRNRQVGLAIAAGQSLDQILASGMTAEGVRCARAAQALGRQHDIELPITTAVCRVLFEGMPPRDAVSGLLARVSRAEAPG